MTITETKTLVLPSWTNELIPFSTNLISIEEKVRFVLKLAAQNIEHKTGGPFGAAIFNSNSHELISVGVNQVVEQNCSPAHAEIIAIMMAQEKLKQFKLDDEEYVLISSAQPCAMCTGAIVWSGVKTLIYASPKEDVESIAGFDEGPVHPDWITELKKRGITVVEKVISDEASEILKLYKSTQGIIY